MTKIVTPVKLECRIYSFNLHFDNPVFTEKLQNTYVYISESAILTCKLNVSEKAVKWLRDGKPVEETDTLMFLTKKCTHWLAISRAKLIDSGNYACICGNTSTTAFLKVSEKPLKITVDLHVATVDADVRESMDIVLICEVNLRTNKAVWRHNGQVIRTCNRHVCSVQDLEHKLTIRNAKFEDEGDYTVDFGNATSSAKLTIKGNLSLLHKKQLMEHMFRNWIRGALGLKYLKIGLEAFSDIAVWNHHSEFLTRLSSIGNRCTRCTTEILLPSHKPEHCPKKANCLCSKKPHKRLPCPNGGFCSTFYDNIFFDHRFFCPLLTNTDIHKWGSDPWSVATCYISTTGYKDKRSAKKIDCAGLLSLFINNTFFERSLGSVEINGETDLFKQARDARNDILHSANYELSEGELSDYIDLFRGVLEIKTITGETPLTCQRGVKNAMENLNELQKYQIDIHDSEDLQKQIKGLREHAMNELAEKVDEAEKQNRIKLQHLEEQLKKKEKELQLMRDFRSSTLLKCAQTEKVPFELKLHIRVVGSTGLTVAEGRQRIFESMKEYVASYMNSQEQPIKSIDQSVYCLLGYITNIKDCKIADVFNVESSVDIKVYCFTCKAIEEFLKLINGNEFQKETIELRKRLETLERIKACDVLASCSSASLESTRTRLHIRSSTSFFACDNHQVTQCTWYCSDHDKFFCSTCRDSHHRTCVGLKMIVSESSYGKRTKSLVIKSKMGNYNVKIKNLLINKDDNDKSVCEVNSVRLLPNGHILLTDSGNKRIKKLDTSYYAVSHCDLPGPSYGLCYIGKDIAVVSEGPAGNIQFVNISGKMKLEHTVKLDHECYALAFHGDTLYVTDRNTVYTYNKDLQQKKMLYCNGRLTVFEIMCGIAVTDDGERLYITALSGGTITIDKNGNHLFTFKHKVDFARDVCVVGDGTVLVLDKSNVVFQVDYRGGKDLGKIVCPSDGLELPESLCYDRQNCRLIVSCYMSNYVTVFQMQHPQQIW
ncbi:uncharacterized protein LOC123524897 isoform X2 [Mercenaria mercenaria]|uniref:uncharacterized protein LOC123524897 isoform X2 n=1 Tax=Mercenaria mercenaria TaxID=6596 RepID=UPI001E1D5CAB|nr:uncharacterized protein LOC123524897 isoform X2 [Mercenaria mercenaria]